MPVVQLDGQLSFVRISLAPSEVPKLLERHRSEYPETEDVEQRAKRLIASDFPPSDSREFVARVCKWGGGQRLVSRICKAGDATIAQSLKSAIDAIESVNVAWAIGELQHLPHLGLSFASKIARFLAPDKCVVLDSVIRTRIGYVESQEGYSEFLQDCFQLLQMLRTSRAPDAAFRDLRVCDVEAAVFMKVKGKNHNVSP
ncbi:hypothetical protein [Rhizobium leguminosarum]|uniref:8-oxoguanine DNA glycosylase OGG fold protein n=1 Tax=Rhizobium leguminosarum TaxID=384 RepID=UPI001C90FFD1|nr:hypothetical protein [Rhizobium leguminosarum]MBY2983656.1 hypothetical protein [Rhizobium leguminosarum]